MVSTLLLLERALRFDDANTAERDAEILEDCRRTVREILEEAELMLQDLEDGGWRSPNDDAISYAARLLFCSTRNNQLTRAVSLVQEITLRQETTS